MRVLKTGLLGLFALFFVTLAVILMRGALEAPAAADPVPFIERSDAFDALIERDEWGVPHITGERDVDVAFGIGYAHSEDDFATIQEVIIATRGELASVKGQDAAITDYLV